jgi:central kinetochore subunit Mis15/CHL4
VVKTLQRLSRPSLLSLVLDWLDEKNQGITAPLLLETDEDVDEQDAYPPCSSLAELREIYTELQARKGSKRDVVDRILEGDWRDGVSLYQLAMADMQYLSDHPNSQKWSALKIVPLTPPPPEDPSTSKIPRFHPSTFLQNLQREVLPDVKAHYNLDRHTTLPLWILRILIIDSPYNTGLALASTKKKELNFDASKVFYIAFPDASPYIYVSLTTTTVSTAPSQGGISDNRSLRKLTLEAIPKAFSRPRERYKLESTSLSARNLEALCEKRGGGRTNAAGGGWGLYAQNNEKDNPLDPTPHLPTPESEPSSSSSSPSKEGEKKGMKRKREEDVEVVKRRKRIAQGRFGNSGKEDDGKGLERFDVRIEDPFPIPSALFAELPIDFPSSPLSDNPTKSKRRGRRSTISAELDRTEDMDVEEEGWRPDIRVTFHGQHVFAGVRELVERGVIDGERMPGWMTGEEGVSLGVVRGGRVWGGKGSGV